MSTTIIALIVVGVVSFLLGMAWKAKSTQSSDQMLTPQMRQNANSLPIMHTHEIGSDDLAQIKSLLKAGQKIHAIKIFRDQTGVGLKEAKDAVEAIEKEL